MVIRIVRDKSYGFAGMELKEGIVKGLTSKPPLSTCVTIHFEKITSFAKNCQSVLDLGPAQRTLKMFFKER